MSARGDASSFPLPVLIDDLVRHREGPAVGEPIAAPDPGDALIVRLSSTNGGMVYADPSGSVVVRPGDAKGGGRELVGLKFRKQDGILFLLPLEPGIGVLRVEHDPVPAEVISYRLDEAGPGLVQLRDPRTKMFLSVSPFLPGPNRVGCNRTVAFDWETFVTSDQGVDARLLLARPHVRVLARLMSQPVSLDRVLHWIEREDAAMVAMLGVAVLRLLDDDDLAGLERSAARSPAVRRVLASIFSDSVWIGSIDPALQEWLVGRTREPRATVDATFMAQVRADATSDGLARLPATVVLHTRQQVEPRFTVAMATAVHNDGALLLDWLAHHRAAGVEHFFIYSTDGEDGSEALLDALAEAGVITWIRQPGKPSPGWRDNANRHLLSCLPETLDYGWLMVLDVDEFLVLDGERHESFVTFLELRASGGANAVALSRHMFRPGLQKTRHPTPIIERFTHRHPPWLRQVKPVMATRHFMTSLPHEPSPAPGASLVYHNAAGLPHHWPGRPYHMNEGDPIFEDAWIQSYPTRSVEEFIWSHSRNRSVIGDDEVVQGEQPHPGLSAQKLVRHVCALADDRLVEDPPAGSLLSKLDAALAVLRADPAIARAADAVEDRYRRRIDILKSELVEAMSADPVLRGFAASWLSPARRSSDA